MKIVIALLLAAVVVIMMSKLAVAYMFDSSGKKLDKIISAFDKVFTIIWIILVVLYLISRLLWLEVGRSFAKPTCNNTEDNKEKQISN